MSGMRHVKTLFAALAVASMATYGCSKESSSSGGSASAEAQRAIGLFASDTNGVAGINPSEITGSSLFKSYRHLLDNQIQRNVPDFKEFKSKCGIDPFTDFKNIVAGFKVDKQMEPDENSLLFVVNGPARGKIVDCLKQISEKEGGTVTEDGKFTKISGKSANETMIIGWVNENTMIGGPKMDKGKLEERMKGGGNLNKELLDLLDKADQTSGVWMAIKPDGGFAAPPNPMFPMPKVTYTGMYGSLSLSSGLELKMGSRTASGNEAATVKEELEGLLKKLKPLADLANAGKFIEKLEMSTSGPDLVVKISLSQGDIEDLQNVMKSQMGR